MNKTNLDVTKFDDEDYYYEHYKEILIYKIDNNMKLYNDELYDLLEFELCNYREYGDNNRWDRCVSSICELDNRYFKLNWFEGLTEMQENSFYEQPYEVEKVEYEKTITVTEWKAVK